MQIDKKTGQPLTWPITNTIVHWAALMKADFAGEFDLRCRNTNGIAQPLPRPFGRSGINRIEVARIKSETV